MAFGDTLGILSGSTTSITNPFTVTGSVAYSANDLIAVFSVERNTAGPTTTAINDNNSNSYTAQNAGTAITSDSCIAFYCIPNSGGTLTSVSATTTASSNDYILIAVVIAGPFTGIDANPANTTISGQTVASATPANCPATGTLAQASEVVIGWLGTPNKSFTTPVMSSPGTLDKFIASAGSGNAFVTGWIGHFVVASTSTVTPSFFDSAGSVSSVNGVLGTMSFKQQTVASIPNKIITVTQSVQRASFW